MEAVAHAIVAFPKVVTQRVFVGLHATAMQIAPIMNATPV